MTHHSVVIKIKSLILIFIAIRHTDISLRSYYYDALLTYVSLLSRKSTYINRKKKFCHPRQISTIAIVFFTELFEDLDCLSDWIWFLPTYVGLWINYQFWSSSGLQYIVMVYSRMPFRNAVIWLIPFKIGMTLCSITQ